MTRVLITGAAGHIGRVLRTGFKGHYSLVKLADIAAQEPAGENEEVSLVDITELSPLVGAMQGIDCVVHLAGIPDEDTWDRIRRMNIELGSPVPLRSRSPRRTVRASFPAYGSSTALSVALTPALPEPHRAFANSRVVGLPDHSRERR
jgi:NAD-dependent epimerase/dehydratase family protein